LLNYLLAYFKQLRSLYMSPCSITRKFKLFNAILFSALLLTTLIGLPWYALEVGISRAEWLLFWFYVLATGFSITLGYHRLFAHRSFQTNPVIVFLNLFFGAAALEESALQWSSLHRDHHQFVDTDQDPYNIKRGFWHAHIGWMLFWQTVPDYTNVKDLMKNPLVMHQHRNYGTWVLVSGILLPLIIGAATGHLLGAFLLSVAGRITLVHHSTWSINSICHTFGKSTYDIDATAKDHWLVAILTNGEGYHNFHHRFASDYRNGVRWYQWDPTKWAIAFLSWFGQTKKLYRTSPCHIYAAKAAAERTRVERALNRTQGEQTSTLIDLVQQQYGKLKNALADWETYDRQWQAARQNLSQKSNASLDALRLQLKERRQIFDQTRREWLHLIKKNPLIPHVAYL